MVENGRLSAFGRIDSSLPVFALRVCENWYQRVEPKPYPLRC